MSEEERDDISANTAQLSQENIFQNISVLVLLALISLLLH